MKIKQFVWDMMCAMLRRYGHEVVDRQQMYDWQLSPQAGPSYNRSDMPEDAREYLKPDNPRLLDLNARYDSFDRNVTTPLVWKADYVTPEDIMYFRGDNAYVWQLRGQNMNILSYALTTYYTKSADRLGLLDRIGEDDYFGNFTFEIDDLVISRDLLDSVLELSFLERNLGISKWNDVSMLDIGAGYGRLAIRAAKGLPNTSKIVCTDGVAVSTFLSEYYTKFRKAVDIVEVVPLDEIEECLAGWRPRIATNIHSFSECRMSAIDWWLSLVAGVGVEYLMIVPNAGDRLVTNEGEDFGRLIESHGYELIVKEPKFLDPVVQKYGVNPTFHFLFKLKP